MGKRLLCGVVVCFALAACAVPFQGGPSQEEMARADFGTPPEEAEKIILAWMDNNLFDPMSARMEILSPPEKSWWGNEGGLMYARDIHYCWLVKTRIMAKNRMGGYIGWKPYNFFIRNGKVEYSQTAVE